ncbi:acetoin dehydrogenase dihydrolipoyllysine-residue acetyltransferase subunit [Streptomyces monticola]|uniref:Acetoin dehydrogenase dihydrolipoyllysine-residue acetyltransferase subunit n=1 Tax=Streptomyces monticola TaxID=2666263 RepID=A0ABW2JKA1_9ACTN
MPGGADSTNPGSGAIQHVVMPKWGLSMKTGRITEWLVAEGDTIEKGADLVEIDTDKIAGTLESTESGVLRRIVAGPGTDAPVGCTLALVAPAEVAEADIERAVRVAEEQLADGTPQSADGPTEGTVEVAGRRIAYCVMEKEGGQEKQGDRESQENQRVPEGQGADDMSVTVLVHGYGGDKNSWLFVQEPLSAGHRVYALDLPGHGDSAKDVGDGGLETLAATVTGFLDALGIGRAHLVGHSLGAAVATAVAARVPSRVRSLTLVAPAGFGVPVDPGYLRGFATAATRRELRPYLAQLFADPGQANRQLVDDVLRYKRLDGVATALNTLLDTVLALDVTALPPGATPAVAVWGTADRVIPHSGAAALPAGCALHKAEGAGHMVHMEAPGAVVTAVREAYRLAD